MKTLYFLLVVIWLLVPYVASAKDQHLPQTAATPVQQTAGTPEVEKTTAQSPIAQKKSAGEGKKDKETEASSLHRVEFFITGTECPVCLERMSSKMRRVPGVKKVAVSRILVTNYGAVIYDAKLVQWHNIVESVSDENIAFESVKDIILSEDQARRLIDPENSLK
jgi:copper chaperone CopZ